MPGRELILWAAFVWLLVPGFATAALPTRDQHLGPVTDIVVSGQRVFSVSQGGVFEGIGPKLKRVFRPLFRVTSLAVAGDSLLLAGGDPGLSGIVGLYELRDGRFHTIRVADDLVYDVAVHPKNNLAALACADNRVMTIALPGLKTETLQERYRHTAAVRAVAFSGKGDHLASGGLDALVMLFSLNGLSKPIPIQDHSDKVDCLIFSPDSTLLASGARDGKVRIHNLAGRLVRTYTGISEESAEIGWDNNPYVWSLAWSKRGPALMAGGANGSLYQLSTTDNRWTKLAGAMTKPIYSLAFSESGELLIGTHTIASRAIVTR